MAAAGSRPSPARWLEVPANLLRVLVGRPIVTQGEPGEPPRVTRRTTGSLTRRMFGIAALWILLLLVGGGLALDRVLNSAITRSFDGQLQYVLGAMIARAEIGPVGEVRFNRPLSDQRFLEPM